MCCRGIRKRCIWLLTASVFTIPVILQILNSTRSHDLTTGSNTLEPRNHIAYVKVHKAASSTIQNIFLRYGYQRNLTFVLGRSANMYPNVISLTESITKYNIEPRPPNKSFDILCSHVIYNYNAFRAIMPRDTVFLASVREPFEYFISTLHYFRPSYIFNISDPDPISVYLQSPARYEPQKVKYSMTNNRMAFELGFPKELFHSRNLVGVNDYLMKLDREMDMILVVERLEESVVLLRRLLHWQLQDILYLPKNTFKDMRNETKQKLNKNFIIRNDSKEKYMRWAHLDYMLYDFAVQRLDRQIQNQSPDFQDEVRHFKLVRGRLQEFCMQTSRPYRPDTLIIPSSAWNHEFVADSLMCAQMTLIERKFINEVRYRQYGVAVDD